MQEGKKPKKSLKKSNKFRKISTWEAKKLQNEAKI